MKSIYSLTIAIIISINCIAQVQKVKIEAADKLVSKNAALKSEQQQAEFIGFRNTPSTDKDWRPYLSTIISKNESNRNELLRQIKEAKNAQKQSVLIQDENTGDEKSVQTSAPVIGTNFIGIDNSGTNYPLDNTIAVSNGGYIVTCVNSRIEIDDINRNFYYGQSLESFINDANLSTNLCDPKIIYDSGADRFIFFCQTCDGLAASSEIVIGFSLSNNPTEGFYFYKLNGNPLNDNSWFDYPKIAVSSNELYITGNLFGDNGGSFNKAIIFQIPKTPGFSGGNINWQYWYNIDGNPFTLLPVSYGHQGNYGPGIYLVSTSAVTNGSTNINLYEITDDMSASNEQLLHYNITTTNYSTGGDASQPSGAKPLNTGDCRALDGFYLNGIIHFVFHSDIGSGYIGINYNRLTISSATNISKTLGLVGTADYCYPAIASTASGTTDKSVVISFSRSGSSIFPEVRVIACDDNMTWSASTLVKGGSSYIAYSWNDDTTERWGDYSGMSRKQNENPPKVWISGDYGNSQHYWGQWISEVSVPASNAIIELQKDNGQAKIFPNPIIENYNVEFDLNNSETIKIYIYDAYGKLIKELYNGKASRGKNLFTFNKANLKPGTYFLNINADNKTVKNEKILIVGN